MSSDGAICLFYVTSTNDEYAALKAVYPDSRAAILRRATLWSIYKKGKA